MMRSMLRLLLYVLAIFSLSQAAILVRWTALPPEVIGFWRLLGAGLVLLPLALWKGQWPVLRGLSPKQRRLIALSSVFFFAHLWTYFYAAQNTRIANCMILFSVNPVFTALGAWALFRERLPRGVVAADILAFGGILVLVGGSLAHEPELVLGDISAVASAALFSGYILSGKWLRRELPNLSVTSTMYLTTALLFGLTVALRGAPPLPDRPEAWWGIAGLILLPTLLGHALFSWLMNFMNINWMSTGKLLEPVIAAALAALIFQESVTTEARIAFLCTGAAVLILARTRRAGQNP